jgi:excisionase family DNA binding protein
MGVQTLTYSHPEEFQPRVGRSVSIEQAAQLLGVSRRTVYYRIRDGRLRTIRTLGGSQRVLLDSVDEMRASQ